VKGGTETTLLPEAGEAVLYMTATQTTKRANGEQAKADSHFLADILYPLSSCLLLCEFFLLPIGVQECTYDA